MTVRELTPTSTFNGNLHNYKHAFGHLLNKVMEARRLLLTFIMHCILAEQLHKWLKAMAAKLYSNMANV